jgi:hypothetical protein
MNRLLLTKTLKKITEKESSNFLHYTNQRPVHQGSVKKHCWHKQTAKPENKNWACRAFKEADGGRVNSDLLPMSPCGAVCEETLSLLQIYQFLLSAMSNILF